MCRNHSSVKADLPIPPAATIIAKRLLGLVNVSVSLASSVLRPIKAVDGSGRWSISTVADSGVMSTGT